MQIFLMLVCFVVAVAAIIFIKFLNLGAGTTIALVVPLILLVIYSLARIQTSHPDSAEGSKR